MRRTVKPPLESERRRVDCRAVEDIARRCEQSTLGRGSQRMALALAAALKSEANRLKLLLEAEEL